MEPLTKEYNEQGSGLKWNCLRRRYVIFFKREEGMIAGVEKLVFFALKVCFLLR